jgi:hypothetical protein
VLGRTVWVILLTIVAAAAQAQNARDVGPADWLTPTGQISGFAGAVDPAFAIAMLRYRRAAADREWRPGPYPLMYEAVVGRPPFIWVAQDGSHVERVGQGRFRMTVAGPSGLFRSVDCTALEWPDFECSDGERRSMSAPSNTQLVFGRTLFDRSTAAAASR